MVNKSAVRLAMGLSLAVMASSCLGDVPAKIDFNMTPQQRNDGWTVSTPQAEGFDHAAMEAAYRRFFLKDEYVTAYSLLVVRNGKLVAEGYCRDMKDIDRLNNIKSATKSVTSMLVGIAIDEGLISSVTDPVYKYIPEFFDSDEAKRAITIDDLLTMRSGLKWDNGKDNKTWLTNEPASSLRFMLGRQLEWAPGTYYNYSDLNPQLVSGVMQKVTGLRLKTYADDKIFRPLGITDYYWEAYGPDQVTYGAFGLYLKPRDFARIGLLALRNGQWEGEQLVPRGWMTVSTRAHANQNEGGYGYYWWVRPDFNGFTGIGHGGQYIYAIPGKDLLVVMTANPYTNWENVSIKVDKMDILVQMILEAIIQ
ncbi:MAG: beta-lactamase family protein [Nitrospinota bacterium]|nr:beta-lactamase family protein [Nitrospinota bacterium]